MPKGTDRLGYKTVKKKLNQALPRTALGTTGPFIFYERGGGGWWDLGGGGALKKNWLERWGQPKKNEGKGGGGGRAKKLD